MLYAIIFLFLRFNSRFIVVSGKGDNTLKIFVFSILGLFAIFITGCDDAKNRNDKVAEIATRDMPEENEMLKASTAEVAEEPPIVESTTRPPVPIGKRTAWTLDDMDLAEDLRYSDTWNEPILEDWHAVS